MSEEFKPIETQEDLDKIIKVRLERNTKSVTEEVTKKFEGWISPDEAKKSTDTIDSLNKELETSKSTIADLTAKNAAYEISAVKLKVAREVGLPIELAERLNGSTEEELKKDAETLALFAAKPGHQPRPRSTENGEGLTGVEEEFYKRNPDLKP